MGHYTSKTAIPYQTPSALHFMTSFQSEKHWNCVLHTDTKLSGMDAVLNKHTASIFRQPPEDTGSIFLRNTATQTTCYSNLDRIMFLHHWKNLKQRTSKYKWQKCGWFMLGKLNDKYHIIVFTDTVVTAAVLCTTSVLKFLSLPQMIQEVRVKGFRS